MSATPAVHQMTYYPHAETPKHPSGEAQVGDTMKEINSLQRVGLREVWGNEARCFTPWLATNLHLLGTELNLQSEIEEVEAGLDKAGRVDILARQVGTGARVVIENQFGESDGSHCLHLLGYAANADANILVWVAEDFDAYYRSILSWLKESDSIAVYAVKAGAYRVGESLGYNFRLVEAPGAQARTGQREVAPMTMNTYFADFYRPLVSQLRRSELLPVGRGGWRGRWRSFATGYTNAIYATEFSEGTASVFLQFHGDDHQRVHQALIQDRAEIDVGLNGIAEWRELKDRSWVSLGMEAAEPNSETDPEAVRQWLADNILRLRAVAQPYLERVMRDLGIAPDSA